MERNTRNGPGVGPGDVGHTGGRAGRPAEDGADHTTGGASMQPARIFIIQDDFLTAERLQDLLAAAGYAVAGATGRTAGAVELAVRCAPDLAIIDLQLQTGFDGVTLAAELIRRCGVRVLVTTGFPDETVEATGAAALACEVLRKPYSDRQLLAAVARCSAKAGPGSTGRRSAA